MDRDNKWRRSQGSSWADVTIPLALRLFPHITSIRWNIGRRTNTAVVEPRRKINAVAPIFSWRAAPASSTWRSAVAVYSQTEANARIPAAQLSPGTRTPICAREGWWFRSRALQHGAEISRWISPGDNRMVIAGFSLQENLGTDRFFEETSCWLTPAWKWSLECSSFPSPMRTEFAES